MTRGKSHHVICGAIAPNGQFCTKKPGHYNKVRSLHGNEAPGKEIAWDNEGNVTKNPA